MIDFTWAVQYLLTSSPLFLVWLVAIVLCCTQYLTDPKVRILVGTAVGLQIVSTFGGIFAQQVVISSIQDGIGTQRNAFLMVGFIQSLLFATSWGLMLYAVFGPRREPGSWIPGGEEATGD